MLVPQLCEQASYLVSTKEKYVQKEHTQTNKCLNMGFSTIDIKQVIEPCWRWMQYGFHILEWIFEVST